MIALYHNDMSVCAQKVRMTLSEKRLEWQSHHLDLRAGDQQKPEYVKLNPNAVVPTLVDDGAVIIESTVICEYLDDAYPEPNLRPRDAAARARTRLWTKQLDEGIHAATSTLSNGIAFRHQKLAWGAQRLEEFHRNMPDPTRPGASRAGRISPKASIPAISSTRQNGSINYSAIWKRHWRMASGSPATNIHSPTLAMPLTSPGWTTCSSSCFGTSGRILPTGTIGCANGAATATPSMAGPTNPTTI